MESSTLSGNTQQPPIYLVHITWNWRVTIQLILAIVGILGNSLVIYLYLKTPKLMKSTTNRFIAALAVADLITSICIIPHRVLSRVPDNTPGQLYCKLVFSANIMWISIVASIFTLTALTVERYVAISHPIQYRQMFTQKSSRIILIVIWLSAFIINTNSYYVTQIHHGQCIHDFPSQGFQKFFGVSVFFIEYLFPVTIMLVSNIRAIFILQSRAKDLSSKTGKRRSSNFYFRARRQVILTLFVVVISFIVCWSPDQVAFLVFNLGLVPFDYLFGSLYSALKVLAFANSCVNPIIYALTNMNFRQAIMENIRFILVNYSPRKRSALFESPSADDSETLEEESQYNVALNKVGNWSGEEVG